jgi:hypothetical protein
MSAAVCPASSTGRHRVAEAHAEVCYIDDRSVDVDLDVTCELCGASGHCVLGADWRMLEWEVEDPDGG